MYEANLTVNIAGVLVVPAGTLTLPPVSEAREMSRR